jgi:hypothetical protein
MTLDQSIAVPDDAAILDQVFDSVLAHNRFGYDSVAALLSEQRKIAYGMCRVLGQLGLVTQTARFSLASRRHLV